MRDWQYYPIGMFVSGITSAFGGVIALFVAYFIGTVWGFCLGANSNDLTGVAIIFPFILIAWSVSTGWGILTYSLLLSVWTAFFLTESVKTKLWLLVASFLIPAADAFRLVYGLTYY